MNPATRFVKDSVGQLLQTPDFGQDTKEDHAARLNTQNMK